MDPSLAEVLRGEEVMRELLTLSRPQMIEVVSRLGVAMYQQAGQAEQFRAALAQTEALRQNEKTKYDAHMEHGRILQSKLLLDLKNARDQATEYSREVDELKKRLSLCTCGKDKTDDTASAMGTPLQRSCSADIGATGGSESSNIAVSQHALGPAVTSDVCTTQATEWQSVATVPQETPVSVVSSSSKVNLSTTSTSSKVSKSVAISTSNLNSDPVASTKIPLTTVTPTTCTSLPAISTKHPKKVDVLKTGPAVDIHNKDKIRTADPAASPTSTACVAIPYTPMTVSCMSPVVDNPGEGHSNGAVATAATFPVHTDRLQPPVNTPQTTHSELPLKAETHNSSGSHQTSKRSKVSKATTCIAAPMNCSVDNEAGHSTCLAPKAADISGSGSSPPVGMAEMSAETDFQGTAGTSTCTFSNVTTSRTSSGSNSAGVPTPITSCHAPAMQSRDSVTIAAPPIIPSEKPCGSRQNCLIKQGAKLKSEDCISNLKESRTRKNVTEATAQDKKSDLNIESNNTAQGPEEKNVSDSLVDRLYKKHGGRLALICRECFYSGKSPCVIHQKNTKCAKGHVWDQNAMLAHFISKKRQTIQPRPLVHNKFDFNKCKFKKLCNRVARGDCRYYHCAVELDVWSLEGESGLSQKAIAEEYTKLIALEHMKVQPNGSPHNSLMRQDEAHITQSSTPTFKEAHTEKNSRTTKHNKSDTLLQSNPPAKVTQDVKSSLVKELYTKHGGRLALICRQCYYNRRSSCVSGQENKKCIKGHNWDQNVMLAHFLSKKRQIIQSVPFTHRKTFSMCRHREYCKLVARGECGFCHNTVEMDVWAIERDSGLSQEEIAAEYTQLIASGYSKGGSNSCRVVKETGREVPGTKTGTSSRIAGRVDLPGPFHNSHYCEDCDVHCNSDHQLRKHWASEKHARNVRADKERQWNHRQPPWGILAKAMKLCSRHQHGQCLFSSTDDMFNQCLEAHSQKELEEWIERVEWRKMKRYMASVQKEFSYMEELLQEYKSAAKPTSVFTEGVGDVEICCQQEQHVYSNQKGTECHWKMDVKHKNGRALKCVALLDNHDRSHFCLSGPLLPQWCQKADGNLIISNDYSYSVDVLFRGNMFGVFSQRVVFDFGKRPACIRKLRVEVGARHIQAKVKELKEKYQLDLWTPTDKTIMYFDENHEAQLRKCFTGKLLRKYPVPSAVDVLTQSLLEDELNRHNYFYRMHQLLRLEEFSQLNIISRTYQETSVAILNKIEVDGLVLPRSNELFARVPLQESLTDESEAGQLILSKATSALLARHGSQGNVYEAPIVTKNMFDFDGKRRDCVYLVLSERCCDALDLNAGTNVPIQVQFQLDREPVCTVHYALDTLHDQSNSYHVFPDVSKVTESKSTSSLSSSILNPNQMKVVQHVMMERSGYVPPLVVYGPFGTGKTETIAQASMLLLKHKPSARVLICTHSNRAADLYITKHFSEFMKRNENLKMLRVYYVERRQSTVDETVKTYCLMDEAGRFRMPPNAQELRTYKLVITTLGTSVHMSRYRERGLFTHIFIDEAGQALECEAIIPFTLADEKTCVVLAGDHRQITPVVYSPEARAQNFHHSLLERLFLYYMKLPSRLKDNELLTLMLTINYRSKEEILRFISSVYYGGPDVMQCQSGQSDIPNIKPMNFCAVQGEEVLDPDSTSYYNMAEVQEIAIRVAEMYDKWPAEWGVRKADEIAVVAPYYAQVSRIRWALRSLGRPELREIEVSRMENLQGCEFRVMFISTVRTYHIINKKSDNPGQAFGFLSDNKLLNSALTRAENALVVVGDPVALCSIGKCRNVWRSYLVNCEKAGTIEPPEVTWQSVQIQVESIMDIAAEQLYNINDHDPIASEFDSMAEGGFFEEWSLDYTIEPDAIIQQLGKQVLSHPSSSTNGCQSTPIQPGQSLVQLLCTEPEKNHIMFPVQQKKEKEHRRHLQSSRNCDLEFNDEDISDEEDTTDKHDIITLQELLRSDPAKYKKCILKIESADRIYAKTVDGDMTSKEIKIATRCRCGHGFTDDLVVVEILETNDQDQAEELQDGIVPQGTVVGVLKRAINPRYRMFVCTVDPHNTRNIIPLNRGVPLFNNLQIPEFTQKGHVSVYTFTQDRSPRFHHNEPLNPANPNDKIFIARYLKWDPGYSNPLCIVVGVKPAGNTLEHGMAILDIEHCISRKYKMDTEDEMTRLYHREYTLPEKVFDERNDMRDEIVFTIDPPESKDLDDALSITELSNGEFRIGIHIADVSHFVQKDSYIDREALLRGTSYYPVNADPVHMIPNRLATDLCSLLPDRDRLTISIFICINNRSVITSVNFQRCVVCSKHKLTYSDVESMIKDNATENTGTSSLRLSIIQLHKVATVWRTQRLGTTGLLHALDSDSALTPHAHLLVEEIMIKANTLVAGELMEYYSSYGNCVPLRIQPPPNEHDMDSWWEKHETGASQCPTLASAYQHSGKHCECIGACACVPNTDEEDGVVNVSSRVWSRIIESVSIGNLAAIRQLLLDPMLHPQQAIAALHLYLLQERSFYGCAAQYSRNEQGHSSLKVGAYTHFTSPIRRYIDLVVHRMLVAKLECNPPPYNEKEIIALCEYCTEIATKSRHYEEATKRLALAEELQIQPRVLYPVVECVDEASVRVRFPTFKQIPSTIGFLSLNSLKPAEKPDLVNDQVTLKWRCRLYDRKANENKTFRHKGVLPLPSDQHTVQIDGKIWQELVNMLCYEDESKVREIFSQMHESCKPPPNVGNMSSEQLHGTLLEHFCQFQQSLKPCSLMRIQVSSAMQRGMLMPSLQLFNVTPRLDFCLEHQRNPLSCFAHPVNRQASKQHYNSLDEYEELWCDVLALEAAHAAVDAGEGAYIHNIAIKWEQMDDDIKGSFQMSSVFAQERQLKIAQGDFFCIRYHNVHLISNHSQAYTNSQSDPVVWVGHFRCIDVNSTDEDDLEFVVCLRLLQSAVPFPSTLLKTTGVLATVEWLPNKLPYRIMENTVRKLKSSSDLVKKIAQNEIPSALDPSISRLASKRAQQYVANLLPPNDSQESAIRQALGKPFTLIQGPPGTGKTVTGVRLACLLAQTNRTSHSSLMYKNIPPQLLYCGPSNKSVDVVTAYLKKAKLSAPTIVRIYGERLERVEFPLPGEPIASRRRKAKDNAVPAEHKGSRGRIGYNLKTEFTAKYADVALHHLIRRPHMTHSKEIREYDARFQDRKNWPDISLQEIHMYENLLNEAKKEVIATAEILLCTCTTAASPKLKRSANVIQVIIDECSMSMEPESMSPLVSLKPRQIILIGDHCQLRPIVLNERAGMFGLSTSLFQRYSQEAAMLTVQYRMHEAIAKFPSEEFYDGQLECGHNDQTIRSRFNFWPGGRRFPLAFVHVAGREEMLTVATSEGGVKSASNQQEVQQTVYVVCRLIDKYSIPKKTIAVLTQYRAQCAEINKAIKKKGYNDVTVTTVVESQGSEWDYVVMSTVRSLPQCEIEENPTRGWCRRHLGFITDDNQTNVAITRAKKGLIIIGNQYLLRCSRVWSNYLQFMWRNHAITEAGRFMQPADSTQTVAGTDPA